MNTRFLYMLFAMALGVAFVLFTISYQPPGVEAQAPPTTYGTLDNFDVINDTGGDCHGFEIELEGVAPGDVPYWFGAPYQRYGDPTIVSTTSGVIVRYAAVYDTIAGTWSATTPIAAAYFPPTDGHSCWAGVDPNYLSWGCDHFGVSLNAVPTRTTYRWLVAGPSPGSLVPFGSNVVIPAPVWNVTPAPTPGDPPAVETVISPPAPAPGAKFGEPMWIKVWVTTLPNAVSADDLDHMVIDDPNVNIVPSEPAEVEWEWMLLQAKVVNGTVTGDRIFTSATPIPGDTDAVSRRFEFYKYTGLLDTDPDNLGEALCDNPTSGDPRCGDPDPNGVAGVGDLIGAQNAAVNLAGPLIVTPPPNHPPVATDDNVTTAEDTVLTLLPGDLLGNDIDVDNDPLHIDSVQNAIGGTVTLNGTNVIFVPELNYNGFASFAYTIGDGYFIDTGTVNVTISPVNDPPTADAGPDQAARTNATITLDGSGSSDIDGDNLTYSWSFSSIPAKSRATLSGGGTTVNPTFRADKEGVYVVALVVNDGLVNSVSDTITVTVTKGKR